jgi:hypothetical protein
MKLRTSLSPIRLRLGVLSKRLATATLGVRLRTVALSKRLAVAVGDFIKFLVFADAASTTDVLSRTASKPLSDSVAASESIGIVPNKRPFDGVATFDDQLYFAEDYVVGAPGASTYTLGRQVELAVSKPVSDAMSAAEVKSISFQRSFSESTNVTDDVNGALSEDDQLIEFFKSLSNQAALVDADRSYVMSKILAEIPAAASSGTLYSQGYTVDMSYFAEDYVGESRAFS